MPTPEELIRLLEFPNETLSAEYKGWLDLSEIRDKAKLAKAAIALANHGGGIIVVGMRENNEEGGELISHPRPENLARYSQDDINAAINRYADPQFHCELSFATHRDTETEHAIVSITGNFTAPVMSRRGCDGIIAAGRCYIRKPGPRSEEPTTVDEWRELLDRCVRAGREDMLDAIRLIVQGHIPEPAPEQIQNTLLEFRNLSIQRWHSLVQNLPEDDAAKMPLGHYELTFIIENVDPAPTLPDLMRRLDEADRIKHTGWSPFVNISRRPLQPYPIEGLVEAWLGPPEELHMRAPAHCDFWRAHPDGRSYLQRGFDEDDAEGVPPGTVIDVTLPVWRVGEAMLYVARLARQYGENPTILTHCRYVGLANRRLASVTGARHIRDDYICNDDLVDLQTSATAHEVDDNLAEILHPMLSRLYERFSFFELPMSLVVQELERMRRNRF